jgi:psp operon transcriptional activator
MSLKDLLRKTELDWLQRALAACDQRQNEAAKLLGLSYDQMRALMRKHHQTTRPGRQKKKQT